MEHIRYWAAGAGAVLGDFFGGMDGLLTVLVAFVVLDYITGVLCANEGISITENAARIGLPVPEKLKKVMEQLKGK